MPLGGAGQTPSSVSVGFGSLETGHIAGSDDSMIVGEKYDAMLAGYPGVDSHVLSETLQHQCPPKFWEYDMTGQTDTLSKTCPLCPLIAKRPVHN